MEMDPPPAALPPVMPPPADMEVEPPPADVPAAMPPPAQHSAPTCSVGARDDAPVDDPPPSFVPDRAAGLPWLPLKAAVLAGLYALGVVVAAVVAWVLSRTAFHGPPQPFVMELPGWRWPRPAVVLERAREAAWSFLQNAGTLIVTVSIVVWALSSYPRDERIIDAIAMELVLWPERFDVIVTTNLFGDILSDLISGLVGGLGLAPGANIGKNGAIFEAVHGTAPSLVGTGKANPTALMLAACLMLDHIGDTDRALRVRTAIEATLRAGGSVTPDAGGTATTDEYTDAIIARLG
jgi:hypothetical protein